MIINKKLQRIRVKNGRFPDDGLKGLSIVDITLMPDKAHLSCPQCSSWKLGLSYGNPIDGTGTRVGCGQCAWESFIDMNLLPTDFKGSCPKCSNHLFALIKLGNRFGVGCSKCSWENVYKLENTSSSGLILPGNLNGAK